MPFDEHYQFFKYIVQKRSGCIDNERLISVDISNLNIDSLSTISQRLYAKITFNGSS